MKKHILMVSGALCLCSCASIVTGTQQNITVNSEPAGAECQLSNDKGNWWLKETPGSVVVHRAYSPLSVKCQKGKLTGSETVASTTKGAAFGNILLGGVIGAGVDMANGSAYDYPPSVMVRLGK